MLTLLKTFQGLQTSPVFRGRTFLCRYLFSFHSGVDLENQTININIITHTHTTIIPRKHTVPKKLNNKYATGHIVSYVVCCNMSSWLKGKMKYADLSRFKALDNGVFDRTKCNVVVH